jgi:peptidoglycan-associated lipoprotein
MKLKILGAFAAVALLTACSGPDPGAASGSGGSAGGYGQGADGQGGYGQGAGGVGQAGLAGPGSEEDLVRSAGQYIYFAYNSSQLSPEARATLDRLGTWMQGTPATRLQIAGNGDERGTEEYNIALGQRRANAARDDLVAKSIDAARLTPISYGKDRPMDPASTPAAWAKNRNDTFSVLP